MQCSMIYYIRLREHFQQNYIAYCIDKNIQLIELSKHCLCHDTDKICPDKSDDYSDQILDKGSIPNPLIISLQTKSP